MNPKEDKPAGKRQRLSRALVELTKPRLNFLVVLTAMGGYEMGRYTTPFPWMEFLHLSGGTALLAGASAAINMVMERQSDALMNRTRNRPIPAGSVSPAVAMAWGLILSAAGLAWLYLGTNKLTAGLGLATLLSYLVVYTPSKKVSELSTWIGAVPGALPPVMGWAAATNSLGHGAVVLFAILFFWQIPHFLAIAWMYREDYQRGGLKVTPNMEGGDVMTGYQVVVHSVALVMVSLAPTLVGLSGRGYFLAALLLGLGFVAAAVSADRNPNRASARRMLLVSVFYLPILFTFMIFGKIY